MRSLDPPDVVGGLTGWIEYVARHSYHLLVKANRCGHALTLPECGFFACWSAQLLAEAREPGATHAFCERAQPQWARMSKTLFAIIEDTESVVDAVAKGAVLEHLEVDTALEFFRVLEEQAKEKCDVD
jgi:hypothetical protein